jgi:hypothetical protein
MTKAAGPSTAFVHCRPAAFQPTMKISLSRLLRLRSLRLLYAYLLVFWGGLVCVSPALGQGDTPTGSAGGYGGSITTGAGSFDPYERHPNNH